MRRLFPALVVALALAAAWLLAGVSVRAGSASAGGTASLGVAATTPAPAWSGELLLPFDVTEGWRFTGGNHQPWMDPDDPSVALDWAPPSNWTSDKAACAPAIEWARAIMPGRVTRADDGHLWLVGPDGWEALYLHLSNMPAAGTDLAAGDPVGHPACEGSNLRSDGAHVHLAVMRHGEWVVPELSGWTFQSAGGEYQGVATRGSERVCSIQVLATEQGCTALWPGGGTP